ncbi:hypothetical protein ONZ43_g4712 [Nemania bipapillata]|uniref:Uncharacterized protein n=1 Tax=Nemania bipapillata TaxID=110536 RepID=A0ACC2IJ76_9PEZI|nr:hypothetical protein ONZ43_g4712 [Nemania bipapillata]
MADSPTDLVSTISSIIGAVIGIITLVTVYVAARQLLTEHRAYQMGLSPDTLGSWHDKVKTKRLLGLQQEICTPTITLPMLLKQKWTPNFVFPLGTSPAMTPGLHDPEKALAKASWVNFVEALGLRPDDNKFFHMNAQSTLVNGIVPMRWAGKDLVGVCAMLGFQSPEKRPNPKKPMKLPMQWSGPLGWLQFREDPNGCVVEFRRRANIANQLPKELHEFCDKQPWIPEPNCLLARLWRSINGLVTMDGKALYLGGTHRRDVRRAKKRTLTELKNNINDFEELMAKDQDEPTVKETKATASPPTKSGVTPLPLSIPELERRKRVNDKIFDDLMQASTQDEVRQILRDPNHSKSESERGSDLGIEGHLKDLIQRIREKELGKMEVLNRRPGLLSVVIHGELADSRGLNTESCEEYGRSYVELSEVDQKIFPYRLGDLVMDKELLKLMKGAMELLKPDGFFFTPTTWLASDIDEVYTHIESLCDDQEKENGIFPEDLKPADWPSHKDKQDNDKLLCQAMILCNSFQHTRTQSYASFTVEDMIVVAKVSRLLRKTPGLAWAMLISPDLFNDLARAFGGPKLRDSLKATVTCRNDVLYCTELMDQCGIGRKKGANYAAVDDNVNTPGVPNHTAEGMTYDVPLCPDGEFDGRQVLASFLDVMITYFWTDKRWVTDVELYDNVIPQTITMC